MAATQSHFVMRLSHRISSQHNLRADARVSSSSCEITRTNRSWALPVSLKVQNFQSQRVSRRGSPCLTSSCDITRSWALPCSLKVENFQSQRVSRRGSPCLVSFENGGFLRSGIGEADGVIIVDHGSRRRESNLMLEEFVKMFKDNTGYPIVEPAHMELAEPSIKSAFSLCVEQGAKRVVVSPFFLFPGRHWHQDIPALMADAAKEFSDISYLITAPLGLHNLLIDVVNDRIQHCLSHVEGDADECLVCAGTNKCKLYNSS